MLDAEMTIYRIAVELAPAWKIRVIQDDALCIQALNGAQDGIRVKVTLRRYYENCFFRRQALGIRVIVNDIFVNIAVIRQGVIILEVLINISTICGADR